MTADAGPIDALRVPLTRRLFGIGSIFGKTLRDSRRAVVIVGGFCSVLLVVSGAFISSQWGTAEARAEGVAVTTALPPIFTGLFGGTAEGADTLGGFTNWRYGLIFFMLPGVWSILALSGTLVVEMRRGSMEFVAGSPIPRWRIALEKLSGHVVAMTVAMLVVGIVAWLVGVAFATLPGDEIPLAAALGYVLLMGLVGLAAGSIAFAFAVWVGRGAAAGIAAVILVGSWLVFGFRESLDVFDSLAPLSWFSWTAGHRPIAGTEDWASLLPLAAIVTLAGGAGVWAFERRDLGQIGSWRLPSLPQWLLGISGPLRRALGELITPAVAWGVAMSVYVLIVTTSSEGLEAIFTESPTLAEIMRIAFPNLDITAPGFGLQLLFVQIGTLFIGFAAATIVGGWASDEAEGRLELLLTAPVARMRWLMATGLGAYLAIIVTTMVLALAAAIGLLLAGDDPVVPFGGTFVLALYGTAVAGVGIAVGGLLRPSLAAAAVVVIVVGSFLIEIIAPILDLPDWVSNLVLASHFGEPMLGSWDPVGIIASLVLAIGGLLIGAWGFARRDLRS